MNTQPLTDAVTKALTPLIELAAKDAAPIQKQIAKIKGDIAAMNEGDFAAPALTQVITQLEAAEAQTIGQSKAVLASTIVAACKELDIPLAAPTKVGNGKKPSKRLTADQKAQAADTIMKGNEINNGLSRGQAATIAGITPEQATTVLKALVDDGKVAKIGTGKNTTYKKK